MARPIPISLHHDTVTPIVGVAPDAYEQLISTRSIIRPPNQFSLPHIAIPSSPLPSASGVCPSKKTKNEKKAPKGDQKLELHPAYREAAHQGEL